MGNYGYMMHLIFISYSVYFIKNKINHFQTHISSSNHDTMGISKANIAY